MKENNLAVIDPDKAIPIEFRVLLKIGKIKEEISSGGIIIPDAADGKDIHHEIIAEYICGGESAFTDDRGKHLSKVPQRGDKVLVAKYAGLTVQDKDGNLYRVANDKNVAMILED